MLYDAVHKYGVRGSVYTPNCYKHMSAERAVAPHHCSHMWLCVSMLPCDTVPNVAVYIYIYIYIHTAIFIIQSQVTSN